MRCLIHSIAPPFSNDFALSLTELMSSEFSKNAILSSYFVRNDSVILNSLHEHLFAHSSRLESVLKHNNSDSKDDSEELSRMYYDKLMRFLPKYSLIVKESSAIHRL